MFVSYSHGDKAFVDRLLTALRDCDIRVWIDSVDLLVGDSSIGRTGNAIREGDCVDRYGRLTTRWRSSSRGRVSWRHAGAAECLAG